MINVDVVWMKEVPPDWSSRLIMFAQGTPYSHVGIIGTAADGKRYLCHCIDVGVCYQDPDSYLNRHKVIFKKTVDLHCSLDMLTGYIMGEDGKEYSDVQLVLIALKLHWASWFMNDKSKRICSEFVGAILSKWSTYNIPEPLDFVTPKTLFEILKPEAVK